MTTDQQKEAVMKEIGSQGRLGAYLNTVIADLEIDGKGQYFRDLFSKYDEELRSALSQIEATAREEEKEICKKLYIEGVDWGEWNITKKDAAEMFDEEHAKLTAPSGK